MSESATEFLQAEADLRKIRDREMRAAKIKNIGHPIEVKGKIIRMLIRNEDAWTVESTAIARRTSLQTGKTLQIYRGHTAPVTCMAFHTITLHKKTSELLITGSWDKTIKIWNTEAKECVSSTVAHNDFLKTVCVIPSLGLLASGSSDKTIRIWDMSVLLTKPHSPQLQLPHIGTFTGHTRPIECLSINETLPQAAEEAEVSNPETLRLYSADSMGVIKSWSLDLATKDSGDRSVRGTVAEEHKGHSTGINEMTVLNHQIWTGSTDCTVTVQSDIEKRPSTRTPSPKPISHPFLVRAILPLHFMPVPQPYLITGSADKIFVWDITSITEKNGVVEKVTELDAHAHDITAIGFWVRSFEMEGKNREAWIVTGSLDGTIRRWHLGDLLNRTYQRQVAAALRRERPETELAALTEEEERELAELMED